MLSTEVQKYLDLTKKQKKVVQYLYFFYKKFKVIFPKQSNILKFAKCSHQCLKDFHKLNAEWGNMYFKVMTRFERKGRQTSNLYEINKGFLEALEWLEIYGYMNSPKKKHNMIKKHVEKEEKVTPLSYENLPPLVKILRKDLRSDPPKSSLPEKSLIHPEIGKMNIPEKDKIFFSNNSEAVIQRSIERLKVTLANREKIRNPVKFFCSLISYERKRINGGGC
jgi:hypothetical protein